MNQKRIIADKAIVGDDQADDVAGHARNRTVIEEADNVRAALSDDVEGHRFVINPAEADRRAYIEDAEGDDVEGHRLVINPAGTDLRAYIEDAEGDDVEGHRARW